MAVGSFRAVSGLGRCPPRPCPLILVRSVRALPSRTLLSGHLCVVYAVPSACRMWGGGEVSSGGAFTHVRLYSRLSHSGCTSGSRLTLCHPPVCGHPSSICACTAPLPSSYPLHPAPAPVHVGQPALRRHFLSNCTVCGDYPASALVSGGPAGRRQPNERPVPIIPGGTFLALLWLVCDQVIASRFSVRCAAGWEPRPRLPMTALWTRAELSAARVCLSCVGEATFLFDCVHLPGHEAYIMVGHLRIPDRSCILTTAPTTTASLGLSLPRSPNPPFHNNLNPFEGPTYLTMDSPTAADRARKMEMRQEAAAVAAATAAAAAVVSQAYTSGKEDGSTRAQDTASIMMTLATGASPAARVGAGALPAPASPSTPVGRGKGKGRASHLGPTYGIGKSRRVATESPVGILSAASSATASPSASRLAPRLAPRPPTYPPAGLTPVVGEAANPYASLVSGSPLYQSTVAPLARVAPRTAPTSGPPNVGPAPSLASTAPVSPLGTKTATVAGFVVRTTPAVGQSTEGPHSVAPRNGAITSASPVVTGIRRRGHRIPAARLARQLERAGATAAAKRLTEVPPIDGTSNGARATPSSPATEAGLFTRLPSNVGLAAAADGVPAGVAIRTVSLDEADSTGMVVGVDTGTNNVASANNDNNGVEQTPFLGTAARARAADGGGSPKTVAPSVAGSTSGMSTPGVSDIDSAPQSQAPTRPLTWRPSRSIPSPTIEYPLSTTLPSTPADESAVASLGSSATKASKVVENAVRASTANLRVDLAALCARTNDTAARMLQLATKMDTCANLSQQTLVAVRKVEAAVKVAVADVAKQGALPAKVDANAAEELGEKLLDEVKVRLLIFSRLCFPFCVLLFVFIEPLLSVTFSAREY